MQGLFVGSLHIRFGEGRVDHWEPERLWKENYDWSILLAMRGHQDLSASAGPEKFSTT